MFKIPHHFVTEATVQAEFFRYCCDIELPCALELITPVGRLDAAVFNGDWTRILAIVECKRFRKKEAMTETRQIRRYKQIGVPVFGLCKRERAEHLAKQIKRDYSNSAGIPLSEVYRIPQATRHKHPRLRFDESGIEIFIRRD